MTAATVRQNTTPERLTMAIAILPSRTAITMPRFNRLCNSRSTPQHEPGRVSCHLRYRLGGIPRFTISIRPWMLFRARWYPVENEGHDKRK